MRIDGAQTPGALGEALAALRSISSGRIHCVVSGDGCVDRTVRRELAAAAELSADRVILTLGNPRTEDPGQILNDLLAGFHQAGAGSRRCPTAAPRLKQRSPTLAVAMLCSLPVRAAIPSRFLPTESSRLTTMQLRRSGCAITVFRQSIGRREISDLEFEALPSLRQYFALEDELHLRSSSEHFPALMRLNTKCDASDDSPNVTERKVPPRRRTK